MDKKRQRLRRALRARSKMRELGIARLSVHRTPRHIYAQVLSADGDRVIAAASTVQREVREAVKSTGNIEAASLIGRRIAEKAVGEGVTRVAFDRSGFRFHGRVKALADAARENGLQF
ncbi:MAG: 50S ribosomal protein L18 [Halofilum sp. (in: g-proteobacteria)]|nr:50S ribosomal protein L18 [Halofilum sp. (in: g-proteobacteria)]